MTRRKMRKLKRELKRENKAQYEDPGVQSKGPLVVATGRISGGISETYIQLRSMPSADHICSTAIRKVVRGLTR